MGSDVQGQLDLAQQLLRAGDVDAAASTLGALVDATGDPTAHYLRGAIDFMDDRLDDACRDWEAAFQGFRDRGELARAARAAMGLAELHVGSLGHVAAGQGWLGRARRLLDRVGPCVEHGWFEIALLACTRPNVDDLLESADRALEIALEYGDPDLEVRALADSGLALVSQGRMRDGFARLDEALAAITGGQLRDPSVAGVAFCSMLSSCDRSGDLRRAEEWNRLIDELILERLGGRPPRPSHPLPGRVRIRAAVCRSLAGSRGGDARGARPERVAFGDPSDRRHGAARRAASRPGTDRGSGQVGRAPRRAGRDVHSPSAHPRLAG